MSTSGKRLVFFGNERLVSGLPVTDAPVLRRLIDDGYDVAAIVAHHAEGQSRSDRALEVAEIGREQGIPVLLPADVRDILGELKEFDADAAVLVAYGQIVPQSVIDTFPHGIVNVHPSLLPRYRGSTPIETAVANGDRETGVSLMQLAAAMDAGPIFAQVMVTIEPHDTKFDVYTKCVQAGAALISESLPGILNGASSPRPQDEAAATYTSRLTKQDAWLDPARNTAEEADRLIRAHLGYPKSKLNVHGHDVVVLAAHPGADGPLVVTFKDATALTIDELVAPSGKRQSGAEFLRGYVRK